MKRKHIDYFDFLRGLAIIFVVFNHSYSADPMSDGLIDMIYLLIRQIVTCAVPIFLAQSAFFLSKKNFVNKSEYFSYLKSHSLRIWIPMVIWSLPLFFIKDHHNYIGSFIYMLIGGYSIYYFIPLIIQFYVLQPVYKRFARNWGVVILFVINAIYVAVDNYIVSFKGVRLSLFFECAPFVMWVVYPAIGYYIGTNGRDYKLWPWYLLAFASLCMSVLEARALYPYQGEGLGVTKISSMIFSISTLFILFSSKLEISLKNSTCTYQTIVDVGKISFGIYLIHKYFLEFAVKNIIFDTAGRTVVTMILSVLLIISVKKTIHTKIAEKIGFR